MDNDIERIEERGIMPFSDKPDLAGSGEFESPVFHTPLGDMVLCAQAVQPSEIDEHFNPEDQGTILDDDGKEKTVSAFEAARSGRLTLSAQVERTPTPQSLNLGNIQIKVWLPGGKLKFDTGVNRSDEGDGDSLIANISRLETAHGITFTHCPFYTREQLRELNLAIVSTSEGGDVQV